MMDIKAMKVELDRLTATPGITAAYACEGEAEVFSIAVRTALSREATQWQTLLQHASSMFGTARSNCGSDETRIMLAHTTILTQKWGAMTLSVAFCTGDPVVKSLARMLRKAFRRLGSTTQ